MHKLRLALSAEWSKQLSSLRTEPWEVVPDAAESEERPWDLLVLEISSRHSAWKKRLEQARGKRTPVLALYPAEQPQVLAPLQAQDEGQGLELEWFPVLDWESGTLKALSKRLRERAAEYDLAGQLKRQQQQQQARESLMQKLVHDMKSPLTVMLMDLGMLERWWEKGDSARFQVGVERVTQNCEELIGMIQNLLDANRMRQQELEVSLRTLGMGAVLREVLENPPSAVAKKNIQLQLDLRNTEVSLELDGSIMGRVLESLLKLAARTTPKGGIVEVRTRESGQDMEIEVGIPQAAFDARRAQALLQPYAHEEWRALGVDAGNGIGFNFCRMAVERHGGTLGVEGRESGVALAVRLPVSPRQL
ncbi:MAG TPA: HAMP domain-containing sensor histidine kinase [Acidobacteriota bacterium]|nr:HAMP domain-containing sensor histidine kinase [Acidobacteriota bacterium]